MQLDFERLIHSFKTAIACGIAFLLTKLVGLAADQWIVITVIVVMCAQIYVGSVLQKAYLRFLGTLLGCLLAALTLSAFGSSNLAILGIIALSSFLFSYLATGQESQSYAGTLGAVTTAIIMLGPHPTLLFAAQRFLEISVGILIATLISQFVLPIHARHHLRRAQGETLAELRDFYIDTMTIRTLLAQDLDENIVKSISKQRQLAKESARERLDEKFDADHFMQTLYCEKEILRSIALMRNAFTHINNAETSLAKLPELHTFNDAIQQTLNTFINVIESKDSGKEHIHLPNVTALRDAVQTKFAAPTPEQRVYIDGFLFSAEVLTETLAKMASLNQIPVYS